ncbi:hypothetical protein HanIR_Chr10g0465881 [Helianthus annuus]|nr:hypothetical protein HanIR_Chr10g0465881 [Helianthus annuus]
MNVSFGEKLGWYGVSEERPTVMLERILLGLKRVSNSLGLHFGGDFRGFIQHRILNLSY